MIAALNLRGYWTKVHGTLFAERGRKCCRSPSILILHIYIGSGDICAQIGKGSEIGPNLACFWRPIFLGGGQVFKFLDQDYKIERASDLVAKFRGDRRRDLRHLALKTKMTRNLGQSPTWVRLTPLVRLGKKFRGWNSPGGKVTWTKVKCISIRKICTVDLGWVNISRVISGVIGPKFTNFIYSTQY